MSFYTGGATNFKRSGQRQQIGVAKARRSQAVGRSRGLQTIALVNARSRVQRKRVRAMGEVKGMDTGLASTIAPSDMTNNADMHVLNLIQQGTGSWNRIGRKVYNKSIRLTGQLNANWNILAVGSVLAVWTRIVIVWDSQPAGTLPTKGDILGSTSQAGVEGSNIYDHLRYDNMDRFRILKDEVRILDMSSVAQTTGGNVQKSEAFDIFINLNNAETLYSGQSNPLTIGDISSGALYCIFLNDLNPGGNVSMSNNIITRLRYTD